MMLNTRLWLRQQSGEVWFWLVVVILVFAIWAAIDGLTSPFEDSEHYARYQTCVDVAARKADVAITLDQIKTACLKITKAG